MKDDMNDLVQKMAVLYCEQNGITCSLTEVDQQMFSWKQNEEIDAILELFELFC